MNLKIYLSCFFFNSKLINTQMKKCLPEFYAIQLLFHDHHLLKKKTTRTVTTFTFVFIINNKLFFYVNRSEIPAYYSHKRDKKVIKLNVFIIFH